MQKKIGICIAFLLTGCSTDSVPDEEFEAPTLDFPLLGNVPDRPPLPEPETFARQQKRLKSEHDQAIKQQDGIIKSIKP